MILWSMGGQGKAQIDLVLKSVKNLAVVNVIHIPL